MERAKELLDAQADPDTIRQLRCAAKNGSSEGYAGLAHSYKYGRGVKISAEESYRWLYLAAKHGHGPSQTTLGRSYFLAKGVPVEHSLAKHWLSAAVGNGEIKAKSLMGILLLIEYDKTKDQSRYYEALGVLQEAADQGSGVAYAALGNLYYDGAHTKQDKSKAKEYFSKGAELGNVEAEIRLKKYFADAPLVKPQLLIAASQTREGKENRGAHYSGPSLVELFAKTNESVFMLFSTEIREKSASKENIESMSQGSAVAVTMRNAITNCHTLEKKNVFVVLVGAKYESVRLVYSDLENDLCVVRADRDILEPVTEFRPYGTLRVGETVYALGSPRGLQNTLSEGIISGLRRNLAGRKGRYIQTSAAFSAGSSGGGLFDSEGKLVGVTSFILKNTKLAGFAISIDEYLERAAGH